MASTTASRTSASRSGALCSTQTGGRCRRRWLGRCVCVFYSDDDGTLHAGWTSLRIAAFGSLAVAASADLRIVPEILCSGPRARPRRQVETGEIAAAGQTEIDTEIERGRTGEFRAVRPLPETDEFEGRHFRRACSAASLDGIRAAEDTLPSAGGSARGSPGTSADGFQQLVIDAVELADRAGHHRRRRRPRRPRVPGRAAVRRARQARRRADLAHRAALGGVNLRCALCASRPTLDPGRRRAAARAAPAARRRQPATAVDAPDARPDRRSSRGRAEDLATSIGRE